jgi:hypothetical protein
MVSASRVDTERGFIVTGRQISRTEAGPLMKLSKGKSPIFLKEAGLAQLILLLNYFKSTYEHFIHVLTVNIFGGQCQSLDFYFVSQIGVARSWSTFFLLKN